MFQPRRALILLTVTACLAAAVPATAAGRHGDRGPHVIPPVGHLYDVLGAAWWKYVVAIPSATNPLTDNSGARCAVRQSGPVFFLGGDFNSDNEGRPVTRDQCVVPPGRFLFFPLVNAVDVHTPADTQDTPEEIWDDLQVTAKFSVFDMHASVDGVAVDNLDPATSPYRGCSGPVRACAPRSFTLRLPEGNLFGIDAGVYRPAVADGFYLLLAPLKPGAHTVTFGGHAHSGMDFAQEITYHLVVSRR